MIYLSTCSGIEAATVAWEPLDWRPAAFAETAAFPSAVLAHHYPKVPNLGDLNRYREWPDYAIDLLVGGTPCQSFSIAGLRRGLVDPRGNLALAYIGAAARYRPRWVLWENVPGVLSSNKGRDFGTILGALGKLGYGFAFRVLDAQYVRVDGFARAVPQRRRRVFVVGYLGDWRRAAAVLFESEGLRGSAPPRRQAGQRPAGTLSARPDRSGGLGTDLDIDGGLVAATLGASDGGLSQKDAAHGRLIAFGGNNTSGPIDVATVLLSHGGPHGRMDFESETFVASTISARMGRARGTACLDEPLVAFDCKAGGKTALSIGEVPGSLRGGGHGGGHAAVAYAFEDRSRGDDGRGHDRPPNVMEGRSPALGTVKVPVVAYDMRGREGGSQFEGPHDTANIRAASGGSSRSYVQQGYAVRRLTPLECERLQGMPDGYTDVRYGPRRWTPDGPRYQALGNSMSANVMRWLGRRIAMVDRL